MSLRRRLYPGGIRWRVTVAPQGEPRDDVDMEVTRSRRLRWAAALTLALAAGTFAECNTRVLAHATGSTGWFRADVEPKDPDDYRGRIEPVDLGDPGISCTDLVARVRDAASPLIVLVHGIGGEGPEMHVTLPLLMRAHPASVFMFRWVVYEPRDVIVTRLAAGLSRLARCLPDSEGRLVVLAHSAGGVLASLAAHQVRLPPATRPVPWVTVLTVASPLSGKHDRPPNPDGGQEALFFFDLGTRISSYPAAAPGVRVVHLRTRYPADWIMEPNGSLSPNDPSVGVPGAPQIELPEGLGHPESLGYVAGEIAADRWKIWRDGR